MTKYLSQIFCLSLALTVACKPTTQSTCLSTSTESLRLAETHTLTQGGYIQFGDKACNATFDVTDVGAETIRVKAYSARHCRFENALEASKPLLHLYFAQSPERGEGYIKNIRVREDFSDRATTLMTELKKLGLAPEVEVQFLQALKIPTHAEYDAIVPPQDPAQISSTVPSDAKQLICQNDTIIPRLAPTAQTVSDLCWSALDVGEYQLEIRRSENVPEIFKFLSQRLNEKKRQSEAYLAKNPKIANFATEQKKDLNRIQSLLRFQNYSKLAYLLSFDHCKISQTGSSPSVSLCKNQPKLIELAGFYLAESDSNGNKTSVFDRLAAEKNFELPALSLAELKSGKRFASDKTPASFALTEQKANRHATDMYSVFRDVLSNSLKQLIDRIKQNSIDKDQSQLSSAFIVSTNLQIQQSDGLSDPSFAQFPLTAVSRAPQFIQIATDTSGLKALDQTVHGVTQYGTLRIGVPQDSQRLTFGKTDSGSLITFNGVVPLMVLNTVDDQGVSGGASILALPEAQAENFSTGNDSVSKPVGPNSASNSKAKSKGKSAFTAACK